MDRMIYTAMSGAKATMARQDALANNLANANTPGFRADLSAFRAVPVRGEGMTTRVHAVDATAGFSAMAGPVNTTGRALDIAIQGPGWFAVQGLDGNEAYTRSGGLELSAEGTLQTRNGLAVLGDGGPIVVPQGADVSIGSDGTVSARVGNAPVVNVGTIKLINPPVGDLRKGADGLMRTALGEPADADPTVIVAQGALEGSNVNAVEAMVGMIAAARQFEMQMKMLQNADNNEQRASKLLSTNG
ncbi:MAG: flagellar basal body rod protein FlgF [Pseudomonadota bacterium]|jgi:flagellar basal-body rod protein FlgF